MKTSAQLSLSFDARRANLPVAVTIVIGLSIVVGMLFTNSAEEMLAYLLLTVMCAAPCALWVWSGGTSIPLMPTMGVMFYVYYALPILRGNAQSMFRVGLSEMRFGPSEILAAAATVGLFLFVANLAWGLLVAGVARRSGKAGREIIAGSQLNRLMVVGLTAGIVYYLALLTGLFNWLGAGLGFVRAIMLTAATVACFLFGHARARGLLRGRQWRLALAGVVMLVILSWMGLFLIGGVLHCLAVMAGYIITAKRVPWVMIIALAVAVTVLHAGKDEMRRKYWLRGAQYGAEMSISQMPGMMLEWVDDGVRAMASGRQYDAAVDRASLLTLLLQAQRLAPDYVSFLEGRTYALLPQMLVPRFIDENKIASQAAMILLNIHFGIQTAQQTVSTSIGWGLIAEAYANFGRLGVIGVALLLGTFMGAVERWSDGTPLASFQSLFALAVLMQLLNVELDASALLTTLLQTVVAVSILLWLLGMLSKHKQTSRTEKGDTLTADSASGARH